MQHIVIKITSHHPPPKKWPLVGNILENKQTGSHMFPFSPTALHTVHMPMISECVSPEQNPTLTLDIIQLPPWHLHFRV